MKYLLQLRQIDLKNSSERAKRQGKHLCVILVNELSKISLDVHFFYQSANSVRNQQQSKEIQRAGVGGCACHDYAGGDGGDNGGLSALHELDGCYDREVHDCSAKQHECPLSERGHDEVRGREEDGQQHRAEEGELVRDGVGVRGLEAGDFRVEQSEEQAGHELEQLAGRVVVLEQQRAGDHGQEEELEAAHAAAPQRLPGHREEDASRAVPAREDAEHDGRVEHCAAGLEAPVVGAAGQKGHQLVAADHCQVVRQEAHQEREVNVLQHRNPEVSCSPQLQHHQHRHQQHQGQRRQSYLWLIAYLFLLEVIPLNALHSRQSLIVNQSLSKFFVLPHISSLFDDSVPIHLLEIQIKQADPILPQLSTGSFFHIFFGIRPQLLEISSYLFQLARTLRVHNHHKQTIPPQFYAVNGLTIVYLEPA